MRQVLRTCLLASIFLGVEVVAQPTDVDQLRARASNRSLGGSERAQTLEALANKDPSAAEDLAAELVGDSELDVAMTAVQLLSDAIVMSNHPITDVDQLNPKLRRVMERHHRSRQALYPALGDSREEVRSVAARTLTALGDDRALDAIRAGVGTGLYSDADAVNYYGLAGIKTGGRYISPYLDTGSLQAKESAVQYLGRSQQYQGEVRNKVLLDSAESKDLRATAANVLGTYDKDFSSYAAGLVETTDLPPEVYTEIVERYLDKQPRVTPDEADNIRRSMDVYIERGVDQDRLRRLESEVDRISPP